MGHPKQRPPRSVPTPTPTPAKYQYGGLSVPMYRTPPFYGSWPDQTLGMGIKKEKQKKSSQKQGSEKGKRSTSRQKQSIQKRPSIEYSIVKPKLHKNIPMTNYDLI